MGTREKPGYGEQAGRDRGRPADRAFPLYGGRQHELGDGPLVRAGNRELGR
jgi:hypothetical protein